MAIAIAWVAGSCGGDDRAEIDAAIGKVQKAFDAGDLRAVCTSITEAAQAHIRAIGHGSESCLTNMTLIHDLVQETSEDTKRGSGVDGQLIKSVSIDGDSAIAMIVFPGARPTAIPLAKEGGEWKVNGLYGGMPAERQEDKF